MENLSPIIPIISAISVAHTIIVLFSILARQKEHFVVILLINIFFGWTIIY